VRRIRMTTRQAGGREAVSHYNVVRRLETPVGKFTLLEVKIDTGRTHQIRVHMASLGHPIAGDTLYGAPQEMRAEREKNGDATPISLPRNFLHAAELELSHPRTGVKLSFQSPLPPELLALLATIEQRVAPNVPKVTT
jgi:23S rRNA pseudouridine1911/1915/1917 synthase